MITGLKPVIKAIGEGLPDYLTSPVFAEKFGKIIQKVVVIALVEHLEISSERIHREDYKK